MPSRFTAGETFVKLNPTLTDSHNRTMRKLRVSLTDHCNYHCLYCMPAGKKFERKQNMLRNEEYDHLVGSLIRIGLEEIRVTGGEPCLHPDFIPLMETFSKHKPLKLGVTTNGQLLEKHLPKLKEFNAIHLNVSLDSLDNGKFHQMTRGGDLNKVLSTIEKSLELGFQTKINCVVMGGINDDEINDFISWSESTGAEVRFLEYMSVGPEYETLKSKLVPADTLIEKISEKFDLIAEKVPKDSTSFNYTTKAGGKVGFIASETRPFCGDCSRLRLSSTGMLRSCLMKTDGLNIRGKSQKEIEEILPELISWKPTYRIPFIEQSMHEIGG